jgi:hypothetical protein
MQQELKRATTARQSQDEQALHALKVHHNMLTLLFDVLIVAIMTTIIGTIA